MDNKFNKVYAGEGSERLRNENNIQSITIQNRTGILYIPSIMSELHRQVFNCTVFDSNGTLCGQSNPFMLQDFEDMRKYNVLQ